jgi:hypothetical protein
MKKRARDKEFRKKLEEELEVIKVEHPREGMQRCAYLRRQHPYYVRTWENYLEATAAAIEKLQQDVEFIERVLEKMDERERRNNE